LLKILPFKDEHLEDAAELVRTRYKDLRGEEPLLPDKYQAVSNLLPLLENIKQYGGPGVAAIQDGRLVGFMIGWLMPDFRGKRSVYSPEWANAVELQNSRTIYEELYRHLAAVWVQEKYTAHYLSLFTNDTEAVRAWHYLGFGMTGVDSVRGLEPIRWDGVDINIRRAGVEDIEALIDLHEGLKKHMRSSPSFFISETFDKGFFEAWLEDPSNIIWLAHMGDTPAGFIRIGPANDDVSTIIYDKATTSIYGAYPQEGIRGKEIGTGLLAQAIDGAKEAGYERCAVDFEPMNLSGAHFWQRHGFRPVCISLLRYVDERVVDDRLGVT